MTRTILKPLDEDCLLDGELHPSIALRLQRVREIPSMHVANLHGVERIEGKPHLVWEYVPGQTLESVADSMSPRELAALRSELLVALSAMHSLGLVHGAIHPRNVIIAPDGTVKLTHVSALLYTEAREDLAAVEVMFDELGLSSQAAGEQGRATGDRIVRRAVVLAGMALLAGVATAGLIIWYVVNSS